MSFDWINDTSMMKSEDLNLSKKNEDQTQELSFLQEKIFSMEKNYVRMEKYYSLKIKTLYEQLYEKDNEYKKLKKELLDLKKLGTEHMKKVEDLVHKHKRNSPPPFKSRSPNTKSQGSANKQTLNVEVEPNSSKTKGKSFSPKTTQKKVSPSQRILGTKKTTMFQKTNVSGKDVTISRKNNSSEEIGGKVEIGKKFSPKK